jgi:NADPH:quinone reductase-like Zn-dependent oxidoreductase
LVPTSRATSSASRTSSTCKPLPTASANKPSRAALAHVTTRDLELPRELIEAGTVRPQIDRCYRFTEPPAAIAYLEQGHAKAKVVVGVA